MKEFNIYEYKKECPLASFIENTINNCSSDRKHLDTLIDSPMVKEVLDDFMTACLLYWSTTMYYDDRNRVAVLISRELVQKFPSMMKKKISDNTLKEAFGFTMCAHRYLQQVFFNVTLLHLKDQPNNTIYNWYERQEFVIDKTADKAVPYQSWRIGCY